MDEGHRRDPGADIVDRLARLAGAAARLSARLAAEHGRGSVAYERLLATSLFLQRRSRFPEIAEPSPFGRQVRSGYRVRIRRPQAPRRAGPAP